MTNEPLPSDKRVRPWHLLIFLGLFAFQAAHLAADPSPLRGLGDFSDEGLWNHNAHCKVLFGTFLPANDAWDAGIAASPLFTLVQWAVFSVLGVGIFAARLWPLLGLWLIMVMAYALMRRVFGANGAVLAVLMIGLSHELLSYAKWSTPIVPEACFLLAALYFWEMGRVGRPAWMAFSTASLGAAALTKLTAVHFAPAMALFVAASYWVRKDVDTRRVLWFLAGGLAVSVGAGLYFLLGWQHLQHFMQTVGARNVSAPLEPWWQLPRVALYLPFKPPLRNPGAIVAMMLASLWAVAFGAQWLQTGFRAAIRAISGLELYCACWLLGCVPSLLLVSNRPERRFVMFLVPATILAAVAVVRAFEKRPASQAGPTPLDRLALLPAWCKLALVAGLVAAWSRYAIMAIEMANLYWLQHVGAAIPRLGSYLAVGVCLLIAAWYILSIRRRYAVAILLAAFFAINILLSVAWYASPTYTLRDASRTSTAAGRSSRSTSGGTAMSCRWRTDSGFHYASRRPSTTRRGGSTARGTGVPTCSTSLSDSMSTSRLAVERLPRKSSSRESRRTVSGGR